MQCKQKKNDRAYSEHFFHPCNTLPEDGSKLVSNPSQQEAEQWNSKDGIQDAENLASNSAWGNVSIPCREKQLSETQISYAPF